MHKRYLIIFLFPLLFSEAVSGQLLPGQKDRITPFFGISNQFLSQGQRAAPNSQRLIYTFFGVSVGMNYVLLHSNDMFSLGINPNLNASFAFDPISGFSFLGQVPMYMLVRIGARATPYNESRFGVGVGVGGNYSYIYSEDAFGFQGTNTVYDLKEGIFFPGLLAELNLRTRMSDYGIRVNWNISRPAQLHESSGREFDYGNFGFGIFYTF